MLTNKTILIISPQSWGKVFVSKHHYAITLAEKGNTVYFLNPIDVNNINKNEDVSILQSEQNSNLFFINHSLFFPYKIKFHAIGLFHWLMNFHLKKIFKKIGSPIDIIWSFDLGNYFPLRMMPGECKIFHPVDEPLNITAFEASKGADIIFAVTKEISQRYTSYNIPCFVVDHGLSNFFVDFQKKSVLNKDTQIHVGLSGNHTRTDIDWPILLTIINQSPSVVFEFWGPYENSTISNNGLNTTLPNEYIELLQKKQNVIFHGSISTAGLISELNRMDAFLICYDILKDQSKGTNYHKVLEYLSTGKVVISNNITAYQDKPALVQMTKERDNNSNLPYLFNTVINNIEAYNTPVLQKNRICFAEDNTYSKQIERIEGHLNMLTEPL